MQITIGGRPLRFSKYQQVYVNLLQQPTAKPDDAETGWIHLEALTKEEAKKIYEAVYRRVTRHCTGERLQSSKARMGDDYVLSLRRVAVI